MGKRMDKKICVRLADEPHALIEELASECDRPVSQMARRLVYERLAEIAAERQQQLDGITATGTTAAA